MPTYKLNQSDQPATVLDHYKNNQGKFWFLIQRQQGLVWVEQSCCRQYKNIIIDYIQNKNGHKQRYSWKIKKIQKQKINKSLKITQSIKPSTAKLIDLQKQVQKIKAYLNDLDRQLETCQKHMLLDYQLDLVAGVFKFQRKTTFVVQLTGKIQPVTVNMQNMRKYFPKSLRRYFLNLLNTNIQKIKQLQKKQPTPILYNKSDNKLIKSTKSLK